MKNKYCKVEWWINQIENKCKIVQKESEEYKKSDHEFKKWFCISIFVFVLGVVIEFCANLQSENFIKAICKSCKTTLLFIASILAGFAIYEYRNRSKILENASSRRAEIFEEIIQELENKGILEPSQVNKCIRHITNGATQMGKSGKEGLSALKDVVEKVIKEICS